MPTLLPQRPPRREIAAKSSIDWLAAWGLSVAAAGAGIAGIVYFSAGDPTGAACVLFGAAAVIAIALSSSPPPKRP
jgi:hypothetical protein